MVSFQPRAGNDEERQQKVRETVMKCAGTIEGGPDLAENARSEVRARIERRHRLNTRPRP